MLSTSPSRDSVSIANLIANPGAVDIWIVPVTEIGESGFVEKLRGLLTPDELARSDRFINPEHGRSFAAAGECCGFCCLAICVMSPGRYFIHLRS